MKKLLTLIICVICIAAVVFGKLYWNHRIAATAVQAKEQLLNNNQSESSETKVESTPSKSTPTSNDNEQTTEVDKLTAGLPQALADKIQQAVQNGKTLQFLIVTDNEKAGWLALLQKQLNKSYGEDVFDVSAESYGDQTTFDFLQSGSYSSLFDISSDIDIILFQSLIQNDQGEVSTEDTLLGTLRLQEAIKEQFPDITFIVQPPNPMYQRPYFTDHVDELRQYADENDILYINHWKGWPDPESENLLNNLRENGTPNKNGNQLWAQYLGEYFTSQ